MQLIEVTNAQTQNEFNDFPRRLYKNDNNWVCPPDNDINQIFNPQFNTFFSHGKAIRWILKNEKKETIGRVAAFINNKKSHTFQVPTGGMGFFECIDNAEAAHLLFDACKTWLQDLGMEAMDGPINFGENDRYWGLLVHGFIPPAFGMPYNPPYYKTLFENYGFKMYFEQVSNSLDLTQDLPERFTKIAQWVADKPGFSFKHLQKKDFEKFANDFVEVYNTAWIYHENFSPMKVEDVKKTFVQMSPIIDERFIWFAYHEMQPIGFIIMVPDINPVLQKMNGKTNILALMKFFYYTKIQRIINASRIIIMGVVPKFQKSGIESAIIMKAYKELMSSKQYLTADLSWVGDFNPKMRALHESLGAKLSKIHNTYRVIFDENKNAFERSTIIDRNTKEQYLKQQEDKT